MVARWTGAIAIVAFGMFDGCYHHRQGVTETTIEAYGDEPFSLFWYGQKGIHLLKQLPGLYHMKTLDEW